MLRDAGIPARYANGYAVIERDAKRGEYVLRGTHGHAWCRVWDQDSRHLDRLRSHPARLVRHGIATGLRCIQRFNDGLKRLREDFFIWRNRPANRLGRLARHVRHRPRAHGIHRQAPVALEAPTRNHRPRIVYDGPVIRTPLHDLEPQARKHLGHRPPGEPFAWWLASLRPALPDSPDAR